MRLGWLCIVVMCFGCGKRVTKVDANVGGNTVKYKGFPVCIEVTFVNKASAAYPKDLCSAGPIDGNFAVRLSGQADDPANDHYQSAGQVFLRAAGGTVISGTEQSRSEEIDGETARVSVSINF